LDELARDIAWFKVAVALPVLTLDDIPQETMWKHHRDRGHNISHEQLLAELGLNGSETTPTKSPSD